MSTRAQIAAAEPSEEQKRSKVWRHPDAATLHALLLRGKDARWIEAWLAQRYPTEDAEGLEHPDAQANAELQISAKTLDRYRAKFYPEAQPVIEGVVNSELEQLIGYRLPAPIGIPWELDLLETVGINAAQVNLARAMKADAEMEMLQSITLEAHQHLVQTLAQSVSLKSQLGLQGYEAAPDRQHIVTQNEHYSVELQGRLDPHTGQPQAVDESRLDLARQLLSASPEERLAILQATQAAAAAEPVPEATVVEDEAA